MQTIGDEREDATRWPLHERLAGAVVRALCVAIAVGAASSIGARDCASASFSGATIAFACAFVFFGLERRDAGPIGGTMRLAASALASAVAALLALAWVRFAEHGFRDPLAAYNQVIDALAEEHGIALAAGAVSLVIVAGPIVIARRLSEGFGAQLGAGLVTVLLLLWIAGAPSRMEEEIVAAVGALVVLGPVAIVIGDRFARRLDPRAPRPRATAWRLELIAASALLVPSVIASRAVVRGCCCCHHNGNECAAIGALKTIATSQSMFRERWETERTGVSDYAANLGELGDAQLIDSVLASGVKQGYLFRLTRSATTSEFLWCATADPITPGVTGDRHFFVNQNAILWYTTTVEPFEIDPETCAVPTRALAVGH